MYYEENGKTPHIIKREVILKRTHFTKQVLGDNKLITQNEVLHSIRNYTMSVAFAN